MGLTQVDQKYEQGFSAIWVIRVQMLLFSLFRSAESLCHTKWNIPPINCLNCTCIYRQCFVSKTTICWCSIASAAPSIQILPLSLDSQSTPYMGFPAHLHTCSSFPHQSPSRHTSSLPLILSDGVACLCQAFQPSFTVISCLIWSCLPVLWILDYLLLSVWICPPVFWPFPETNK